MSEFEPASEDPELLFAEYLEGAESEPPTDVEPLLARAGTRREELADLFALHDAMESVRSSTPKADPCPDGAPAASPTSPAISADGKQDRTTFGHYERLQHIEDGGLSRVYLAWDAHMGRSVALKVLTSPKLPGHRTHDWLLNEGRSIARLEHPGIVRVYNVEQIEGVTCIAMEHVRGPSLREVLRCLRELAGRPEKNALPVSAAAREAAARLRTVTARCELIAELAEALAYCHEHGVIHRDIKPANVLLADGVHPKLIDFGLAHIESDDALQTEITQRLMGTPAYIAPEQVDDHRTGASELCDQFSLGVVLVELISLSNPFSRDSHTETMDAISRAEPPRPRDLDPTISEDLERICVHAVERDPRKRYPGVAALAADLRAFLEHRAISLHAPTTAQQMGLWARRNRRGLVAATVLGVAGLLALTALRVTDLGTTRAALTLQLESLAETLPSASLPRDFSARYLDLDNVRRRAAELDASLFSSLFFSPLGPRVQDVIHACSRRVSELFADGMALVEQASDPARVSERENGALELLQRWKPVLLQDRIVCPECTDNRDAAQRGTVELPQDTEPGQWALFRHGVMLRYPVATTLEPTDVREELIPGYYRLIERVRPDPPGSALDALLVVHETEFTVRFEAPRFRVDPKAMSPTLLHRFLPCPATMVTIGNDVTNDVVPAMNVEVSPFFIMRSPITWNDIGRLTDPERQARLMAPYKDLFLSLNPSVGSLDPDSPAVLTWREAQQFAEDCGARLPTLLEWRAALTLDDFELPDAGGTITAEWTSLVTIGARDTRAWARYRTRNKSNWNEWSSVVFDYGVSPGTTFRLARSSP